MRRTATALAATAALVVGGGPVLADHLEEPDIREPISDPFPDHIEEGALQVELQVVARGDGLTAPNWGTWAPGQPGILYVVDQDGPLWALDLATGEKAMVLDTSELLVPLILEADERGFLGAAFHPDFPSNGLLYTMTSEPGPLADGTPPGEMPNHYATIREWRLDPAAGLAQTPPSTSRVVLQILEPQFNHNGGALFFGSRAEDRHLMYVTSGDGGCADDQHLQLGLVSQEPCISHEGPGNAQRLDTLLGKILRIDPRATETAPYTAAGAGIPDALPEIWAYGLRNPFRASTDRADLGGDGTVWTVDVGQNMVEEVDGRLKGGENLGWRLKEGEFLFNPNGFALNGFASDGFIWKWSPEPAGSGLTDPLGQYDHDDGVAGIGGFVYRGAAIPALRGTYVFGDYSDGFHSGNGRVLYLDEQTRERHAPASHVLSLIDGHLGVFVLGMGEDAAGELYVLANEEGGPAEEEGVVARVVERCDPGAECLD